MTTKHFIAMAEALKSVRPVQINQDNQVATGAVWQFYRCVDALVEMAKRENARFDEVKFRQYIEGGK